ncbi:MAG: ester cyclase [SAR202 cluster bacterium]|nr:ester cyclase [SAR202 cluster bacterium]
MGIRENKAALLDSIEAFNDPKDRQRYFTALYTPDAVIHSIPGYTPDLDGFRKYYGRLWAAFPDMRLNLEDVVAEGDVLAPRFTGTGTNTGPLGDMAPTGKRVTFAGMTVLYFRGGKCFERWGIFDQMGLMRQLRGG